MHTEDGVHALQSAPLHILLRFTADFLGHLEDELDGTMEFVPVGLKNPGRAQKHGGVAVVAAGVHDAGVYAAIGLTGILLNGQGVNVRPEHDGLAGLAAGDGTDAAGNPIEELDGNPDGFQLSFNKTGRLHLVLAQLRVSMEMAAGFNDIILLFQGQFADVHYASPPALCSR